MKRHRVRIGRKLEGVGGEFGMLLPAQLGAAECDMEMLVGGPRRRDAAAGAEIDQGSSVGLRLLARGIEGEMQHARGRRQRRERARMHLAQHRGPQPVRLKLRPADRDFGAHGPIR